MTRYKKHLSKYECQDYGQIKEYRKSEGVLKAFIAGVFTTIAITLIIIILLALIGY